MRTFLQILVGLILGATGIVVGVYLGLVLNGPPDLKAGVKVSLLVAIGLSVSFFAFRHHAALQMLSGVALCIAIAIGWVFSPLPMFWEIEDQPHVYAITWRSAVAFLFLFAITQVISLVVFRLVRRQRLHLSS